MKAIIFIALIWAIVRLVSAIHRKAQAEKAEREQQRIREEQAAIREQMRMDRDQMRLDRERAKEETRARVEAEKQRLAWQKRQDAINKQAAQERARLAKEQERQAKELAKHDEMIENLAYRINKAEDEIYHFSAVLEAKNAQRESMVQEIDEIKSKLELLSQTLIDPRCAESYITAKEYDGSDGAILFAERYAKALDTTDGDRKKAASDVVKLRKRKETLESKVITLDTQIFNAEQKIKKAQHDKYSAEQAQRKLA